MNFMFGASFGFTFFLMYLRRGNTFGVTSVRYDWREGGANVYGAFDRVCSIFVVLPFRSFRSNVPPKLGSSNVWLVEIRASRPADLLFRVNFLGFCIMTHAYSD
jgi:hypothetical protein